MQTVAVFSIGISILILAIEVRKTRETFQPEKIEREVCDVCGSEIFNPNFGCPVCPKTEHPKVPPKPFDPWENI